ncbi:DUF1659 domain-containing protein [Bacillus sp. Bva_UNVM-123]|uniref:DUF1659 domain-containing protein n=1 Tax=Bacillus sp. Bva_UNVM-123 TaxID=2829798 RepID=UPI00391F7239
MAEVLLLDTKLRLRFETGMNEKGEPIYKTKTYGNIKKEATAEQLLQFAQAVASLCHDPLSAIVRNDSSDIVG